MDLDLSEIGQTLAVGALLLFGLEGIVRLVFRQTIFSYKRLNKEHYRFTTSALLLALVLGIGIIAEDLSKSIVGKTPPSGLERVWLVNYLLPNDRTLRMQVLFENTSSSAGRTSWTGAGLAREIAGRGLFGRYVGERGRALDRDILRQADLVQHDLVEISSSLFYQAKNILYQHDTYFEELTRLESRLNFARSFAFIAAFLFVVLGVAFLLRLLCPHMALPSRICGELPTTPPNAQTTRRVILLSVALVAGCYAARMAYISEQFNYNIRVIGYFSSLHDETWGGSFAPPPSTPR